MKRKIVFACNYNQFRQWQLSSNEPTAIYVVDINSVRGIHPNNNELIFLSGWLATHEILDYLKAKGFEF